MKLDFTMLAQAIITLVSIIITYYLIPLIKAKVGEEKFTRGVELAKLAVKAAEQIFGPGTGAQKFEYVVEYVSSKIDVDELTLKNMIEAAVLELKEQHLG